MKESSGKVSQGLLDGGTLFGLGNFDECLSIIEPPLEIEKEPFKGKYCSISLVFASVNYSTSTEESESISLEKNNQLGDNYITLFEFIELLIELGKLNNTIVEPMEEDMNVIYLAPGYRIPGVGLCLPSVCTAKEIRHAVAQLVGRFIIPTGKETAVLPVTATSEDYCYTADKPAPPFDGPAIAVM